MVGKLCKCGCGNLVTNEKYTYLHSHWSKSKEGRYALSGGDGNHWTQTPEGREKLSRDRLGKPTKPNTEEQKRLISKSNTKYWFEYSNMSNELAYLIGAYLSDGYIGETFNHIELTVVDMEFIRRFKESLLFVQPNQHIKISRRLPRGRTKQITYRATACNRRLCKWIRTSCDHKNEIPKDIFSSKSLAISCLEGLLDGDGGLDGKRPYLATSCGWIFDAHSLAKKYGLCSKEIFIQQTLPNGKPYRKFVFDVAPFQTSKIAFTIERKQLQIKLIGQ